MKLRKTIKARLREGAFIPAHPLALHEDLSLDEERQRALTRYYLQSGVDGIAIAVHTTQFEIREKKHNLFEKVLALAADEIDKSGIDQSRFIKVAGICGPTEQALEEAKIAIKYGYDLGLVSNGGLEGWTNEQLLERTQAIAEIIPVFGFYLQPAVGGRVLDLEFWKAFVEIDNVEAIKVASFNRYQTLDVVKALCESNRCHDIDLYTGNDDNLVADLLTEYVVPVNGKEVRKRFVGGLLGHWSVWTKPAVRYFREIKEYLYSGKGSLDKLLALGIQVTDLNQSIFDPQNGFKGSIAGIHEVLRREGLLAGLWCLSPKEVLSSGQKERIDQVINAYPMLIENK